MIIKKIEQYAALKNEACLLKERLARLDAEAVQQADSTEHAAALIKIKSLLSGKMALLYEALTEIELFLAAIDDSETRQLIVLRYVEGLTWLAAATRVYGEPCGDRARKRVARYIRKADI